MASFFYFGGQLILLVGLIGTISIFNKISTMRVFLVAFTIGFQYKAGYLEFSISNPQ